MGRRLVTLGVPGVLSGATPSTLLTDLVAYWKLDEESAGAAPVTRADSVGSNDLTDVNNTPSVAGVVGNACDFENSSAQYLTITDNADLSVGDIDFSFDCWVKPEALANNRYILGKGTGVATPSQYQYLLYTNAAGAVFWAVSYSTNRVYVNTANGTLTIGNWTYIAAWHDSVNNLVGIQIDNGTPLTVPDTFGSYDGGGSFYIAAGPGPVAGQSFDGIIDEVGFWKKVLTPTETAARYNGGAGNTYPFS